MNNSTYSSNYYDVKLTKVVVYAFGDRTEFTAPEGCDFQISVDFGGTLRIEQWDEEDNSKLITIYAPRSWAQVIPHYE